MVWRDIILIFVLIALNGFFVSVEFAVVASRRTRLDLIADEDDRAARLVRGWLEDPAARVRLIAATQLGITVVSLALGALGENTFQSLLEPYLQNLAPAPSLAFINRILPAVPLLISLVVVSSFHVVLGEQVPKVAVLRNPEKFFLFAASILRVYSGFLRGFVAVLDWASRAILALTGIPDASPHTSVYSLEEIRQIVSGPEVEGVIEQPERAMLTAIIDFGGLLVRQIAIPRTEILAVEAEMPLSEVAQRASQGAITKFPVYEGSLDQVIGILHVRELLSALLDPEQHTLPARTLAREALFVPETLPVDELLREFRTRRVHIAIVLDEFGGTAGLVTLEDLLEEIVGEVRDPFEAGPPSIQTLTENSALVDGLTLIEEVNDHFSLRLTEPNYDTIAGYMLGRLGRIPQVGDAVEEPESGVRFQVESMDRLRIARVLLEKI